MADWVLPKLPGVGLGRLCSSTPGEALGPALRESQDAEAETLKVIGNGVTWDSKHTHRPGQEP